MKERKRIAEATAGRYRKAGRRRRGVILNELKSQLARSAAIVIQHQTVYNSSIRFLFIKYTISTRRIFSPTTTSVAGLSPVVGRAGGRSEPAAPTP